MRNLRIVLLAIGVIYTFAVLFQDRFGSRYLFAVLAVVSAITPVLINRVIYRSPNAGFISFFVTPTILCAVLFSFELLETETKGWFPVIAAWVVAITFPIWMISNIVSVITEEKNRT